VRSQRFHHSWHFRPGAVLLELPRPFTLWGYTGVHSTALFRSPKHDPEAALPDERPWSPDTRVDLVFAAVNYLDTRMC